MYSLSPTLLCGTLRLKFGRSLQIGKAPLNVLVSLQVFFPHRCLLGEHTVGLSLTHLLSLNTLLYWYYFSLYLLFVFLWFHLRRPSLTQQYTLTCCLRSHNSFPPPLPVCIFVLLNCYSPIYLILNQVVRQNAHLNILVTLSFDSIPFKRKTTLPEKKPKHKRRKPNKEQKEMPKVSGIRGAHKASPCVCVCINAFDLKKELDINKKLKKSKSQVKSQCQWRFVFGWLVNDKEMSALGATVMCRVVIKRLIYSWPSEKR